MKRSLLLLLALPTLARACYNDRDTLGFELRDHPDAQRALTGRFERNPPLYYAMRVSRLRSLPRLSPAEDDDLAVSLDRLGRSEAALAALTPKGRVLADERYRFFANRGTIRAHRWLRRGARRSEMHELKVAEGDIARALRINPNAHFGREATQLEVIRWLERPKANADETLGSWLYDKAKIADPMRGLEGLIMLGGAWESPDVAFALAELANYHDQFSTVELAYARYKELRAAGGHPVREGEIGPEDLDMGKEPPAGEPPVAQSFHRLRAEAEAWNARRAAFMLARLRVGWHPDTDPGFWSGWRDAPMPTLDATPRLKRTEVQMRWALGVLAVLFVAVVAALYGLVVLFSRSIDRRRARRA